MRYINSTEFEKLQSRFQEDGMVPLGTLLDEVEISELRAQAKRYMEFVVPRLPQSVKSKLVRYDANGFSLRCCYAMLSTDGFFREFGNRPKMKELVRSVTGWEPTLYAIESFNKTPIHGSSVPMHQEAAFHGDDVPELAHLWFAIDECTAENGPVRFWLGSHKKGPIEHVPDNQGYLTFDRGIADVRATEVITQTAPPGGAFIHNGLVAHDSLPNKSENPRLAIFCGYYSAPENGEEFRTAGATQKESSS